MAHTQAVGSVKRTVNIPGKRRGLKKFGGERVFPGDIIVRQKGTKFHPGRNVGMGKDYTIFAKTEGKVAFRRMTGKKRKQRYVDVVVEEQE